MSVTARAAISFGPNEPLRVETIQVAEPGEKEVMIKLLATGLCHSDLHFIDGAFPFTFPAVFGHEAIGKVVQCGPGVTRIAVGDTVLPFLVPDCGECAFCLSGKTNFCVQLFQRAVANKTSFSFKDQPVSAFSGIGSFSEIVVVAEDMVVRVPGNVPPDTTCCIACGVTTGLGAVLLSAKVQKGESVVVFGAGGVGLSAIQGARLSGASRVFAVDVNPAKEAVARKLGATDFVNPNVVGDPVAYIMKETGFGADYSFDCVGSTKLLEQALDCVNMAWGKAFQVGMIPPTESISTSSQSLMVGKSWTGSAMGGAKLKDVAAFVDLYMEGKLDMDSVVSHRLKLDQINEGFDMMRTGKSVRSVILFD